MKFGHPNPPELLNYVFLKMRALNRASGPEIYACGNPLKPGLPACSKYKLFVKPSQYTRAISRDIFRLHDRCTVDSISAIMNEFDVFSE